jgi:hypothetical protein
MWIAIGGQLIGQIKADRCDLRQMLKRSARKVLHAFQKECNYENRDSQTISILINFNKIYSK